jgi:hypothetical protein
MTPEIIISEEELINRIGILLNNLRKRDLAYLLTIDGCYGVGKSTLAKNLQSKFSCQIIHLDDYFPKGCGNICKFYDFGKIKTQLEITRSTNRLVIMEGLFIQEVINKIGANADLSIYIRVYLTFEEWNYMNLKDEDICSEENNLDVVILKIHQRSKRFHPGTSNNDQELCKYHRFQKPISRSDIIFERCEKLF